MTLQDLLSQMGIGPKQLTERLSHGDFGGGHDPHVYLAYEPPHPTHGHVASSKHHHGGSSGHKNNAAMSALTLLSFLFFLHILQQCLKDHMMAMSTPPVVIMTAGRQGEDPISKTADKIDKAGKSETDGADDDRERESQNDFETGYGKEILTKVNTAEHIPRFGGQNYGKFRNYGNRSLEFRGFVNAMEDDVK